MKKLVKRYIAESGLLLIGILWGMGFVTVKIGLNAGMNTFYLMWLRFLGSFVLLSILFRKKIKKVSKDDLKAGVILGIIQYFGYVFQTYGAANTTVGKNAFFTAINVIIVPYIFWILNKKRPDIFSFSASIICLIGVGIMSLDSNLNFTHLNKGDVTTIISAVCRNTVCNFRIKGSYTTPWRNFDGNYLFSCFFNSNTNDASDILPKADNCYKGFYTNVY